MATNGASRGQALGTARSGLPKGSGERVKRRASGSGLAGRAWRLLRSRRLAIILLVALGLLAMLGALLPQQDRIGPVAYARWAEANPQLAQLSATLSLGALYSAWWFIALFTLLYVNTLACTVPQLRAAFIRSFRRPAPPGARRNAAFALPIASVACDPLADTRDVLRGRGYSVVSYPNSLVAQKGALALWGSPLFHLGLIVVLTGAAIGGLLGFSGYVEVGEGQGFVDRAGYYLQQTDGPLFGRNVTLGSLTMLSEGHRGFALQLDSFTTSASTWRQDIPSEMTSQVTIFEGDQVALRGVVGVNQPLDYRGLQIYPSGSFGPAPVFDLALSDGSHESGTVYLGRGAQGDYENTLYLPGTIYRMMVRARSGDNGLEATVSERQQSLFQGRLEPGQPVQIGDATLTLKELRQWTGLRVVSDPGMLVLYTGFGLTVLGLALSFLTTRREVWAEVVEGVGGRVLRVGGHSPRLKASFALELAELAESIAAAQGIAEKNAEQSQLAGPSRERESWTSSATR